MDTPEYTPCPTHGTISAYVNYRCRCTVCRNNNTLRSQKRRGPSMAMQIMDLKKQVKTLTEERDQAMVWFETNRDMVDERDERIEQLERELRLARGEARL